MFTTCVSQSNLLTLFLLRCLFSFDEDIIFCVRFTHALVNLQLRPDRLSLPRLLASLDNCIYAVEDAIDQIRINILFCE